MFFNRTNKFTRIADEPDEAVLALSADHPWAFEALVDRYEKAFLRKARALIFNDEDAQDIVQETFVKIYKKAHTFSAAHGGSFRAWAYRILINTAYSHARKNRKHVTVSLDAELEAKGDMAIGHLAEEPNFSKHDLAYASAGLPQQTIGLLTRYYIEGYSHKEIAEAEGVSVASIKTRIHRAREAMRANAPELYDY